jgi:uncharacterized Zn-finger protein
VQLDDLPSFGDADLSVPAEGSGSSLECKYCRKQFDKPASRRVHERLHAKPYTCEECCAAFGRKSNLVAHVRIHRGERPFTCSLCGKGFPIQSSLQTHMKQSHAKGRKPW